MARYAPPDDFNNQPTQHGDYGVGGYPPEQFEPPESLDPFDEEAEPTPWFRRPVLLGGWALLVAILIGLIVYGIIELIHGDQGTGNIPSSTSTIPSTTTTTPSTTPPTTTTTTTPATGPTTSSAVQQPPQQPTHQPTQQPPTHRHHLPPLPSVITIPEVPTVITLPPGLP